MFHRYVDHNGKKMDFDRAAWLMSDELLFMAKCDAVESFGVNPFDYWTCVRMRSNPQKMVSGVTFTEAELLQKIWDRYAELHEQKFNTPFDPDVM